MISGMIEKHEKLVREMKLEVWKAVGTMEADEESFYKNNKTKRPRRFISRAKILAEVNSILTGKGCMVSVSLEPGNDGTSIFLIFTSPHGESTLSGIWVPYEPGRSGREEMGACITYFTRYLITSAFSIGTDEGDPEQEASPKPKSSPRMRPQLKT